MFHNIPQAMAERMAFLEAVDQRDREDGTPKMQRLRQVPRETGQLLAILAASAPQGMMVEVGASAGYSGLWLALACRERGSRLVTIEIMEAKVRLASETFAAAEVQHIVQVVEGDARLLLKDFSPVAFCFIDTEKELYAELAELVIPNLLPGGFLAADNVISHQDELALFTEQMLADSRLDAVVAPIGKGLLVCRKV